MKHPKLIDYSAGSRGPRLILPGSGALVVHLPAFTNRTGDILLPGRTRPAAAVRVDAVALKPARRHSVAGQNEASGHSSVAGQNEASGRSSVAGQNEASGRSSVAGQNEASGRSSVAGQNEASGHSSVAGQNEASGRSAS
ncbi:unnamed protein product [Boreogadus saida]